MKSKTTLELSDVTRILDAARTEAEAHHFPVTIAVTDDGGHLLGMCRMDNCAPVAVDIAIGKARTAAIGRRESRVYEEMVNNGRTAFVTAPGVTALEGGIPVTVDGQVIGAVGVSGMKPAEDSQIAKVGAQAIA